MKNTITLFSFLAFFSIVVRAQFVQQSVGTSNSYLSLIECYDGKTCLASGDNGTLIYTSDGTTWKKLTGVTESFEFNNLSFVAKDTFFATIGSAKLYRSFDGGKSLQGFSIPDIFYSMSFPNSKHGFSVGFNGAYKTSDAATSWTEMNAPVGVNLGRIHFFDEQNGIIISGKQNPTRFYVHKTVDSGVTWTKVYEEQSETIGYPRNICFPTKDKGYIVTSSGYVYKTTNSGTTWDKLSTVINNGTVGIESAEFITEKTGYVTGGPNLIFKTIDGGISWVKETHNRADLTLAIESVAIGDVNNVYFVSSGIKDLLFKNDKAGLNVGLLESNLSTLTIYPNPTNERHIYVQLEDYFDGTLSIINAQGKKVFDITLKGNYAEIDLSNLDAGIYFVKIQDKLGATETQKLIIN